MIFSSIEFVCAFLPLVLVTYFTLQLVPGSKAGLVVLNLASLAFDSHGRRTRPCRITGVVVLGLLEHSAGNFGSRCSG